ICGTLHAQRGRYKYAPFRALTIPKHSGACIEQLMWMSAYTQRASNPPPSSIPKASAKRVSASAICANDRGHSKILSRTSKVPLFNIASRLGRRTWSRLLLRDSQYSNQTFAPPAASSNLPPPSASTSGPAPVVLNKQKAEGKREAGGKREAQDMREVEDIRSSDLSQAAASNKLLTPRYLPVDYEPQQITPDYAQSPRDKLIVDNADKGKADYTWQLQRQKNSLMPAEEDHNYKQDIEHDRRHKSLPLDCMLGSPSALSRVSHEAREGGHTRYRQASDILLIERLELMDAGEQDGISLKTDKYAQRDHNEHQYHKQSAPVLRARYEPPARSVHPKKATVAQATKLLRASLESAVRACTLDYFPPSPPFHLSTSRSSSSVLQFQSARIAFVAAGCNRDLLLAVMPPTLHALVATIEQSREGSQREVAFVGRNKLNAADLRTARKDLLG
ncbi:hypothetical protein Tdes44962_MAKER08459, partial [Teratosphaeria destructans]